MNSPPDFVPSEPLPVVRLNPETHQRELVHLRWGLVPSWTTDPSIGSRLTHARAETVATKPAFRDAFRQRRCLVVVDSFFFFLAKSRKGKRRPNVIQMKDGRPFGVGGIWERWQQSDAEPVETCAVLTTEANELVGPINDRMPVIIAEEDYEAWLDPEFKDKLELERMMQPFAAEAMVVSPVWQGQVQSPPNSEAQPRRQ
jgi:putative SOS response-associated peptidase YedK